MNTSPVVAVLFIYSLNQPENEHRSISCRWCSPSHHKMTTSQSCAVDIFTQKRNASRSKQKRSRSLVRLKWFIVFIYMSTLGRVYLWMLRFKSVGIIIIACLSGMVLNVYCLYIPACWYITTMYGEYIYIYVYACYSSITQQNNGCDCWCCYVFSFVGCLNDFAPDTVNCRNLQDSRYCIFRLPSLCHVIFIKCFQPTLWFSIVWKQ